MAESNWLPVVSTIVVSLCAMAVLGMVAHSVIETKIMESRKKAWENYQAMEEHWKQARQAYQFVRSDVVACKQWWSDTDIELGDSYRRNPYSGEWEKDNSDIQ